jgi:hypothetical protein
VQSRHHLFTECSRWKEQIKTLWKDYGKARGCGHPQRVSMEKLFGDDKAVGKLDGDGKMTLGPLLEFLQDTHVGKWWRPRPPPDDEDGGDSECSFNVEA